MPENLTAQEALLLARELLTSATPLKRDCGSLCGAACCQPVGEGENGMYLFPGEEALYDPLPDWARVLPTEWKLAGKRVKLLACAKECPREQRPLACRVFPLIARPRGRGIGLQMDPRAWPVCPLMPHGERGLDAVFVKATRAAFELLWEYPEHRAFLRALDRQLKLYEQPL